MFKIQQNPTFEANVTFRGQGREQTMAVTFRAKPRSEFKRLWDAIDFTSSESAVSVLVELVEKWDADVPVSKESLALLADHQPGAEWGLLGAYQEALAVHRQEN